MTTGRVDYCTCSTAGVNEKCPRHAPKPPMPEPTPTVIDSDKALARKWYRCIYGFTDRGCPDQREEHTDAHADYLSHMAAEIAAAREAWGVSREAVAGLVEAVEAAGVYPDTYCWCRTGTNCVTPECVELRAALERVKEAQG